MKELLKTTIAGHVLITDRATGKVLVAKSNQIHSKNMARAIARGLSSSVHHQIYKIKLGNQGTYIDSSQQIVFKPPNTSGDTADLYNSTYAEVVDEQSPALNAGNSVTYTDIPASTSTRVIITAVVSANEAVNRATDEADSATPTADPDTDATLDPNSQFFFDELGLFTQETAGSLLNGDDELMLSHLVFSPIEHTQARELTIIYSLIISVS